MSVKYNLDVVSHVRYGPSGAKTAQIKFKSVNIAAGAQTEVIAAVSGKKIRVLAAHLVADQDGTFKFIEGSTDLSGVMAIGLETAGDPGWHHESQFGIVETSSGEGLDITTVTCTLDGILVYVELDP